MAHANSFTITTDLNVDPYYDDFDEHKNFHRILFKPGLAVQARELTQSQSILQNQIDRFAEHIFQEGSIVRGCPINLDSWIYYLKIRDDGGPNGNTAIDVNEWKGKILRGENANTKAIVLDVLQGGEANYPNTKTLYIKYLNSGYDDQTSKFLSYPVGERLFDINDSEISANVYSSNSSVSNTDIQNTALRVTIGDGIIFSKDHFISTEEQSIIAGRYTANVTVKVGYDVKETIVNYAVDSSLLDPAQGSYNYAAPGADRLKLYPEISVKTFGETNTKDFVEIARIRNGVVERSKTNKTIYSEINKYLAQRTAEESGDYLVNGFNLRAREHILTANNYGFYEVDNGGDKNKFIIESSPGVAYVQGYRIENIITDRLAVDKGITTTDVTESSVAADYGSFVRVNQFTGNWPSHEMGTVNLSNVFANTVSTNQVGEAPSTITTYAAAGSENAHKIGTAKIRAIEYESGSGAEAIYKMYLTDIRMTANSFSEVKSIYGDGNYVSGNGTGIADVVLQGNSAKITDSGYNRALFNLNVQGMKTITNSNYSAWYKFEGETLASGTGLSASPVSAPAGWKWSVAGAGTLSSTIARESLLAVVTGGSTTASTGTSGAVSSGTLTMSAGDTSIFNPGDLITVGSTETVVKSITNSTTLETYYNGNIADGAITKRFETGSILDLGGVGTNGARTVILTNDTMTININEPLSGTLFFELIAGVTSKTNTAHRLKTRVNDVLVSIDTSTNPNGATGPWNLGLIDVFNIQEIKISDSPITSNLDYNNATEVTNNFNLNTGQTDNFYTHASISKKTNSSLNTTNKYIVIKLDKFRHASPAAGKHYFTVDSYPVDDVFGAANTVAITTAEIPDFKSPINGQVYDLRDCIDFRRDFVETAGDTVTTFPIASGNEDPNSTTLTLPSSWTGSQYWFPISGEPFYCDFSYYLPRIDRIVVTSKGTLDTVTGVSKINPFTPSAPSDGLTLGYVLIPPYPSLPQLNAKNITIKKNPFITITPVRQRRFTMKDIGVLKQRVDSLEYYTSLSLLENDAKSMNVSDANGLTRFKNGILVDPFTGHNIGDITSSDYSIAIDPKRNELRPSFKFNDVQFEYTDSLSSAEQNGELITLPILSNDKIIEQNQVSGTRNVTGLAYNWVGEIFLNPDSDYFCDAVANPDVNVNLDFNTEAWQTLTNFLGAQWESWETVSTTTTQFDETRTVNQFNMLNALSNMINGTDLPTTTAVDVRTGATIIETTTNQERSGTILEVNAVDNDPISLGNLVQSVNIRPFMRENWIYFVGYGFKPNTKLYAFFNGENVNAHVRPFESNTVISSTQSFDGINRFPEIRLTYSSDRNPTFGDYLRTDNNGNVVGIFKIPDPESGVRFPMGTAKFRLTDSITNAITSGAVTTWGETQYSAQGLEYTYQNTTISTRTPELSLVDVTDTRSIVTTQRIPPPPPPPQPPPRRRDPSGQTFRIETNADSVGASFGTGVFVTKLDVFFASKTTNTSEGIFVELRECDPESGYISQSVIPFSKKYLSVSEINISNDGITNPTTIIFDSPIFLLTDTDYAWVVKPVAGNPDYTIWIARAGETDINTGNRIISNPYAGVFFQSSNDRVWNAIQEEDAVFNLYVANFGTNQTAYSVFTNKEKEYLSVANVSVSLPEKFEEYHGETILVLNSTLTGVQVGDSLVDVTSGANGTITTITDTVVTGDTFYLKDVTLDTKFETGQDVTLYQNGVATIYDSTINSQSTPTGELFLYDRTHGDRFGKYYVHLVNRNSTPFEVGMQIKGQTNARTAEVATIEPITVDSFSNKVGKIALTDTVCFMDIQLNNSTDTLDPSNYMRVEYNETKELSQKKYILSQSAGEDSAKIRFTLQNFDNPRMSPILDKERIALYTVQNWVNNDSTGEDSYQGGQAYARYMTRKVTLAEGQDAEDLKVYLTAYKPTYGQIKVYYKILNNEDSDDFDTIRTWEEMSQVTNSSLTSSSTENKNDFREIEYTIPQEKLTAKSDISLDVGDTVQYVNSEGITFTGFKYYAIKIVLLSSYTENPPRVKDLRAMALQA